MSEGTERQNNQPDCRLIAHFEAMNLASPYTVEYTSIGSNLKEIVFRGDVMEVCSLRAQKVRTWDPNLFIDVTTQSQQWVGGQMTKRQSLISPILP